MTIKRTLLSTFFLLSLVALGGAVRFFTVLDLLQPSINPLSIAFLLMTMLTTLIMSALLFILSPRNWITFVILGGGAAIFAAPLFSLKAILAGFILFGFLVAAFLMTQRNMRMLKQFSLHLSLAGPMKILQIGIALSIALTLGLSYQPQFDPETFRLPPSIIRQSQVLSQKLLQNLIDQSSPPTEFQFEETKQANKDAARFSIEQFLSPYVHFIPFALIVIIFFTLNSLFFFLSMLARLTLHALFIIFPRVGFVQKVESHELVTRYTL